MKKIKIRDKHKWINVINKSTQVGQKIAFNPAAQLCSQVHFSALFWIFKAHFRHEELDSFQWDVEITAGEVNCLIPCFKTCQQLCCFFFSFLFFFAHTKWLKTTHDKDLLCFDSTTLRARVVCLHFMQPLLKSPHSTGLQTSKERNQSSVEL